LIALQKDIFTAERQRMQRFLPIRQRKGHVFAENTLFLSLLARPLCGETFFQESLF
jgi:hypothetical protein